MKNMLLLLAHLFTTIAKLLGPGGARAVVADNLLMKQQLLIINRSRQRSPNLLAHERFLLGFWSLFLTPHRILRAAIIIRPSTLLKFHESLVKRKYRLLFSSIAVVSPVLKGHPKNSFKPSSNLSNVTRDLVAAESPSKLPRRSVYISTKTWSGGF